MNLIQAVTDFCERTGLPVPTNVIGSTDPQVMQLRALLKEGCEALADRGAWQTLKNEASWTTTNQENQGALTTLASNGFNFLIPETLWDRTQKLPLLGPMDSQDWQARPANM